MVLNVKGLAEEGPFGSHLVNLLADLGVLLILLLLLLLLGELNKLILGIFLLLLELSKNFSTVFLLELLLVSLLGETIRSVSESHLAVHAFDVHSFVLSIEFAALFLEFRRDLSNV